MAFSLSRGRVLKYSFAALTLSGLGIASVKVSNDEGARRSVEFWQGVFPIYLHYRTYQLLSRDLNIMSKERADKEFDLLHEKYTEKIRSIVFKMRGFYLKQVSASCGSIAHCIVGCWAKRHN